METKVKTKRTTTIRAKYAVTFEFNVKPPITIRGEVTSTSLHTCAARAVKEAKKEVRIKSKKDKEFNIIGWSSYSVLIDRIKDEAIQTS